jgi:quinol monooxygenase YgiN
LVAGFLSRSGEGASPNQAVYLGRTTTKPGQRAAFINALRGNLGAFEKEPAVLSNLVIEDLKEENVVYFFNRLVDKGSVAKFQGEGEKMRVALEPFVESQEGGPATYVAGFFSK